MKKIFTLSAIALISIIFTSSANATVKVQAAADAGKTFVIADSTGGSNASLSMSTSPGVMLGAATSSGTFILTSMNVNSPDDKQLQYGIFNKYSGYYQTPSVTGDSWVYTPTGGGNTTDLTDPFKGTGSKWSAMGGSGT